MVLNRSSQIVWAPPNPVAAVDRYTLGMAAVGTLMGLSDAPLWLVLALGVVLQVAPSGETRFLMGSFSHPSHESVLHDAVDLGAIVGAWYLTRPAARP